MRAALMQLIWLIAFTTAVVPAEAQDQGQDLYMERCFWCHGEQGEGDGPSAIGMFPRPRDLVRADYKIRSTPQGQLPTDEDLFQVISRGLPGTPMPGWEQILTEEERRQLVSYLKLLSPRFQAEKPEPLSVPSGAGSVEQGEEIYGRARCFMCHGEEGRGDGGITRALNFEWGQPHWARDFSRGWTFKGGHEPGDIYLRITGGLNGTPMGSYQDLFSDEERWDLAHYIASLDREPDETSDDFVVVAAHIEGEIPDTPEAPQWQVAPSILVPLAGQVVLDPPLRWWIPTAGSTTVRALWNSQRIGFLLEWNDPTGPDSPFPDSAFLQFAAQEESKPYFLLGGSDDPVKVWQWQTGNGAEEWTAMGNGKIEAHPAGLQVNASWNEGRWQVIFRGPLGSEPKFGTGQFVPLLFSVGDGANAEFGNARAISTWLYTTLERPPSVRSWLSALVWLLGAVSAELWIVSRLKALRS
jgi:DMSO reductase family type II enzyme heme b subunit